MGISVADNFKHLSKKFLDDRESFDTLADMKAVSDSDIPEGFETYCKATDKRYKFLSTNSVDANTGKWREVEYGGGGTSDYADLENKPQIEGVPLTGNKTASDLGLAKANQIPTVPTKVSQLQNDSGFITNSDLPGVYAGDTAGLVPAAGSDNEGKYLDNDGNWTVVPMPMIGTINRSDIYDTTEKVVGKWTDGRPIYQKVITLDGFTSSGTVYKSITAHGISNLKEYIDYRIMASGVNATTVMPFHASLNSADAGDFSKAINVYVDNTNVTVNSQTDRSSLTMCAILYYTKTTDAANSYNYADENDYSTSEKIIGKWIDGKTLYQKTIDFGALPNATRKAVNHDISGISKIVDISTICDDGSVSYILPWVAKSTNGENASVYVTSTQVVVNTSDDASGATAYVTLKYTKA